MAKIETATRVMDCHKHENTKSSVGRSAQNVQTFLLRNKLCVISSELFSDFFTSAPSIHERVI